MTPHRALALALAVVITLSVTGLASAAPAELHQRVYLLGADTGDLYWSVDPTDEELRKSPMGFTCGAETATGRQPTAPCFTFNDIVTGETVYNLFASPATLLDEHLLGAAPTRFRFTLDVLSPLPYTVQAVVQEDTSTSVSAVATEVSPGVWEGELADLTPFDGTVNLVGVRVRTFAPSVRLTLGTGGESWFELPQPVAARAVPALRDADTSKTAPSSYSGAHRTMRFNDGDWTASEFAGDLGQQRNFDLNLPRDAGIVVAWVETYDTPIVYDALRGRGEDPRKLDNAPGLTLLRGGAEVASGWNNGFTGIGHDSLAAFDVAAGPLVLRVDRPSFDPDRSSNLPYELHIVAVHGPRTLAGMRWRFASQGDSSTPAFARCNHAQQPVPVTDNVTTFDVELDWDTEAVLDPRWTLSYFLPTLGDAPCGESNVGDRIRFTLPSEQRVWLLGPVPTHGGLHESNFDTVFEMDVTYTYAPPAA